MNRTRKVVAIGVLGFGLGAGCAATSEAGSTAQLKYEWLLDSQAEQAGTQQRLDVVKESLGETCVNAINPYLGDGVLGYAGEDTAVSDIALNGSLPCGDNPTAIRSAYRELRDADSSNNIAQDRVETDQARYEKAVAEDLTPYDWKKTLVAAGVVGAFFTAGAGFFVSDDQEVYAGY